MAQKGLLYCFIIILPICSGEECQMSQYIISTVCDTYNVTALSNHLDIRSVMDCASICSKDVICQSAIFDNFTDSCRTFSSFLEPPNIPCSQQVFYAALDIYSTYCSSSIPPVSIFSACFAHSECTTTSDAECRNGKCQCVPGLSHEPNADACLPDCFSGYGVTFQEHHEYYLPNFNDKVVNAVFDPVQCMNLCVAETNFVCRTAELDLLNGICYLSVETAATQPQSYGPRSNFNYYQRDCAP